MASPVLEVRNLTKTFGDFTAVNGISFALQPGEILGVLGPNGAGKTTTMHMLLGLITPTSGTISMFGMDLEAHREVILQRVNFSSTYMSMPQSLTVEENLWVVARLYGLPDVQRKIDDIVKKLE
ncbi:MAG: ATP-binding cassette domain-containing protein, partial [Nitrospirota bacterium]